MKYLLIIILFSIFGCKTRQVEKHTKKERIDTIEQYFTTSQENDLSTKKVDEQTEKRVNNQSITFIDAESFTLTPVDSTQPITIISPNGSLTTFHNGIIKGSRIKESSATTVINNETKNISTIQENNIDKINIDSSAKTTKHHTITNNKNVTSKPSFLYKWWFWLLLFLLCCYLLFLIKSIKKYNKLFF